MDQLQPGDIVHLETPLNPEEARDVRHYAEIAHEADAFLTVDATFAPPPLQDPFAQGADIIMHSGTKYIGGHSDMLCGVLAVHPQKHQDWHGKLHAGRLVLGSVPGSFEDWVGIRSLRTLELRVTGQSQTATELVSWLARELETPSSVVAATVESAQHASLQPEAAVEGSWLRKQMPGGYGPVFAILMKSEALAKRVPSRLQLFHHATSLGGVESMIEWRAILDTTVSKKLLRVSIGVEGLEDLKADLNKRLHLLETSRGRQSTAWIYGKTVPCKKHKSYAVRMLRVVNLSYSQYKSLISYASGSECRLWIPVR